MAKYMLIRAEPIDGQFFKFFGRETRINTLLDRIDVLPCKQILFMADICMYAHEEGMVRQLPMNVNINPFVDDEVIIYYASMGGPYGDIVIGSEGRILDVRLLRRLCAEEDAKLTELGEISEPYYAAAFQHAADAWIEESKARHVELNSRLNDVECVLYKFEKINEHNYVNLQRDRTKTRQRMMDIETSRAHFRD